jgi:D-arabinose 1-dehydrogenase-like Zn-dependent alcohol dehydrogenase
VRARALILDKFEAPLRSGYIDVQEPGDDESVLIKVVGAGMCKSDIGLWKGMWYPTRPNKLPFVLGHENAGIIEKVGKRVKGFDVGDKVLVYAIWPDPTCKYYSVGKYMQCPDQSIPGQINYYGGYAEYLYVPSYRFLVKIDIDPVIAAPLADAGLTSYSAVKKTLPYLYPGSSVLVYGVGGLASYAIQFLAHMAPYTTIIASSRSSDKLKWAKELGAHYAVYPNELASLVKNITDGGVSAVIDLVGTEESARTVVHLLEPGGL